MCRTTTLTLLLTVCLAGNAFAQTDAELIAYAATFPAMPAGATQLGGVTSSEDGVFVVSAGSPANDLEWCVFDSDYLDGETDGYDIFYPVDPSETFPGSDRVRVVEAVSNLQTSEVYGGANGCRIVLGIDEKPFPFFYRGADGVDNDYYVIQHFDYRSGHVQLRGTAADYRLVQATTADGVATPGWYLFYVADGSVDLIAFIHNCDDPSPDQRGGSFSDAFCNASRSLSLTDPAQFRYASPVTTEVAYSGTLGTQLPGEGKEVITGSCTDPDGNVFVFGLTDGAATASPPRNNFFVAKVNTASVVEWTTTFPVAEGSLLFDATADGDFVYAVGRTYGSLPGFTNAGRWDAVIIKIDNATGAVTDWTQFGTSVIDGFGNVTLDDAGNLFVSGAGAQPNQNGIGDPFFLVAKYDAATLDQIWASPERVLPGTERAAESWGGISYEPGSAPGLGRLLLGGWFIDNSAGPVGAQGFLALYDQLDGVGPRRIATATVGSPGFRADWVWGSAFGPDGSIYATGYTTGNLAGGPAGDGDAYVIKYDANLQNPIIRQFGSAGSERFRSVAVAADGTVFVSGHTYGDLAGANADPSGLTGDVVVYRFDADLNTLHGRQLGTPHEERGFLSLHDDRVYVGGMTEGSWMDENGGSFDAFVMALNASDLSLIDEAVLNIAEDEEPAEEAQPTDHRLYPNPARAGGYLRVVQPGEDLRRIALHGTDGRLIARWEGYDLGGVRLPELPAGVYALRTETALGRVYLRRVVLR